MKGYVALQVWQKGMDLAAMVYAVGVHMPKAERFGMTSQMQRAAASVPANIAEGYQRATRKDYARFIAWRGVLWLRSRRSSSWPCAWAI